MLDFYRGKNILLTGHTGFKGTWLCRILLLAGANITGYALQPTTTPSLFSLSKTEEYIHSIDGDVRNIVTLIKAVQETKPDIVFHLAAQPIVRLSYRKPVATFETNIMGTVNILESMRQILSVKSFVNVTTDKVYENKEWPWGYRENENLCGYDPYSSSKSCSELITYSYRHSFFNYDSAPSISTARSGNVIGGGDYSEDRLIPDCVRAITAGTKILIRNPHSIRPYQHVLECLNGYLLLAKKQYCDKKIEGAYNFGPDDESCVTTRELTELFCSAWGHDAVWENYSDNGPYETNLLKLDSSKAKAVLGWKPKWNIKTAIEKTVEFAKLNNENEQITCIDNQIYEYFTERNV